MLLVGLAASDAALPVLASADDKPGLAGTTGLVTAVAAGVLEGLASPAPLNARWRGALEIPEERQLAPIWLCFLLDAVQLVAFGG